jgi:hypothetical protein
MSRQEDAAQALEAAVKDLRAVIERCSDAEWHAAVPNGWTRAAVAMHCATGNDTGTGWMAYMVSGRDIPDDGDFHNRMNDRAAERNRLASKKEVLAALDRTTERARRFVLSLADEELDRSVQFGVIDQQRTAAQFLANMGRHVRGHTEQFKEGLASDPPDRRD